MEENQPFGPPPEIPPHHLVVIAAAAHTLLGEIRILRVEEARASSAWVAAGRRYIRGFRKIIWG